MWPAKIFQKIRFNVGNFLLIKLKVKYFNSVVEAFHLVNLLGCFALGFHMFGSLFYSWKNCFLVFCLEDIMYFSCTFTWLFQRKEAILTKPLLLCESYSKFAQTFKFLSLNDNAFLTFRTKPLDLLSRSLPYIVKELFWLFRRHKTPWGQ